MFPVVASIKMHSKIAIVVLEGTALATILTPFKRLDLEQIIFMMWITPFRKLYINNNKVICSISSRGCEYVEKSFYPWKIKDFRQGQVCE